MKIWALVAALLLLAFAADEGRKGFTSLAIVLGVFTLIACVVFSASMLGIELKQSPKLLRAWNVTRPATARVRHCVSLQLGQEEAASATRIAAGIVLSIGRSRVTAGQFSRGRRCSS